MEVTYEFISILVHPNILFLRNLVPIDTLTLMYNAIVLPHFDYADIVLDSASAASKFKLQSLQTRAARLITCSGPRTSRNPMYKSLSWLSLQHSGDFHKCVIVYKSRNSLAPSYLWLSLSLYLSISLSRYLSISLSLYLSISLSLYLSISLSLAVWLSRSLYHLLSLARSLSLAC